MGRKPGRHFVDMIPVAPVSTGSHHGKKALKNMEPTH